MALNSAQVLSDAQNSLLENVKPPEGWLSPNPQLLPSPSLWGSYISPAWKGSFDNFSERAIPFKSNQFNSAVSQPLGLEMDWLGRDKINTAWHTAGNPITGQMYGSGQMHGGNAYQPYFPKYGDDTPYFMRIPRQKFTTMPVDNKIGSGRKRNKRKSQKK